MFINKTLENRSRFVCGLRWKYSVDIQGNGNKTYLETFLSGLWHLLSIVSATPITLPIGCYDRILSHIGKISGVQQLSIRLNAGKAKIMSAAARDITNKWGSSADNSESQHILELTLIQWPHECEYEAWNNKILIWHIALVDPVEDLLIVRFEELMKPRLSTTSSL